MGAYRSVVRAVGISTLIQKAWPGRLQRFLKDTSGNMAIVVAISALPLMMAGGAAVDYGNWVSVEARLQAAVDAAALAVGREINKTDAELETIALNYFRANFGEACRKCRPSCQP